jgi:chromatin segregation and condensation protein Rec8/ScpA/Scc1 (kleisin family)
VRPPEARSRPDRESRAEADGAKIWRQDNGDAGQTEVLKREIARTQSTPTKATRLSEAEIAQLAEEVNDIDDPDHVTKIIELIKKHEPKLATNEREELETEVSKLRTSTLLALRGEGVRFFFDLAFGRIVHETRRPVGSEGS